MSETGHALNVAHFEQLASHVDGFGPAYNPSNTAIAAAALHAKLTDANLALDGVMLAVVPYDAAVNTRDAAFTGMRALVLRICDYFLSIGASPADVDDVKGLRGKIFGRRVSKKVKPTPDDPSAPQPKYYSSAQTSFAQEIEHYDALIALVLANALYTPNEVDLQKVNLQAVSALLKSTNTAVIAAYTTVTNKRDDRDEVLYDDVTGLVTLANLVKSYVKALFGNRSPEYKQLTKLQFRNEKKK